MAISERESNYYDSVYLADYYASLWTEHQALDDVKVYWSYFKDQYQSLDRDHGPLVVLDVGTGTGRIIHSFLQNIANDASVSLPSVRFIGMDKSPHMVERARDAETKHPSSVISWFVGTATALDTLAPFVGQQTRPVVDLLTFAFSGISHLHEPGAVDRFFSSAAWVLRPGGLALVSVCAPLLDCVGTAIAYPYGEVKEVRSKRLEGIVYREWATGQSIDGDVFTNSLKTEAVRMRAEGGEEVVERNSHNVPLKLLTREEVHEAVVRSGLQFVREESVTGDVIFVVRKQADMV